MAILIRNAQTIPIRCDLMRRLAHRTLRQLSVSNVELSLSFVDDAEIRRLNRVYRRLDRATDVLAFGQEAPPKPDRRRSIQGPPLLLGDVVISVETAQRRVGKSRKMLDQEITRYLIHGILHLCGYDHHKLQERRVMRAQENRLQKRIWENDRSCTVSG